MDPCPGSPLTAASPSAVLDLAWDAGVFRADHVIDALGMTRSTALAALDRLLGVGLVRELPADTSGSGKGGRGRPARRFMLAAEAGIVVGLDAGGHRFSAVVCDLAGDVLGKCEARVPQHFPDGTPDAACRRRLAVELVERAVADAGRMRSDVACVVVGVPAPVDAGGISPDGVDGFWARMNADLRGVLGRLYPHVRVENDAALAALAEASVGAARGSDDVVALLSGYRLGAGVLLQGRLIRGRHGGAGELDSLAHVEGIGGAWGFGVLTERWATEAVSAGRVPQGHAWLDATGNVTTAHSILAGLDTTTPLGRELTNHLGGVLGRLCSLLAGFYDPQQIIVCGALAPALGDVIEVAQRSVAAEVNTPAPAILASRLGQDVVGLGAAAAAREVARHTVLEWAAKRRS